MPLPALLEDRLALPAIGSPMFIVSYLDLVLAQCRAGIVGAFPSHNAREPGELEQRHQRLTEQMT
jgi:nitronate monooxygenase